MKVIIAKIPCTDDRTIQVLFKSIIDPGNQDPIIIPYVNLHTNISVPSLNIRLKRSHRERVISSHIGWTLPDLRVIRAWIKKLKIKHTGRFLWIQKNKG
jgi:hypothetical protein